MKKNRYTFLRFTITWFQLAPTGSHSLVNSMKVIENPVKTSDKVYALIQSLTTQIRKRLEDPKSAGNVIPRYYLSYLLCVSHRCKDYSL